MPARRLVVALSLAGTLAVSACGAGDEPASPASAERDQEATPARARAEIGEVRSALDGAVAALRDGDAAQAEQIVSEGYLEHFENVEGPLGAVDRELNEELEHTIRETLRERIRSGGSVAEVRRMVASIKADLATAERELRR